MKDLYVLKFGGNAIRGHDDLMRLSREIAEILKGGDRVVLVHGGGPEISEEMERRGMVPNKVCGLRITDGDVLDVTETVLRNLNSEVVSCLQECGVSAVGIPGYFCTLCERKPPFMVKDGDEEVEVDLGLVGEVVDMNPDPIIDLLNQGILPVVYPIGRDADGRMLNVNADTMVSGIAAGLDCREMIAITDVHGILRDVSDPSSKIDSVTLEEIDALIADGTISGGMIPKVEACRKAILSGVSTVRMVNGKDPRSIVTDVLRKIPHGTVITK